MNSKLACNDWRRKEDGEKMSVTFVVNYKENTQKELYFIDFGSTSFVLLFPTRKRRRSGRTAKLFVFTLHTLII